MTTKSAAQPLMAFAIDLILKAQSMGVFNQAGGHPHLGLESIIGVVKDITTLGIGLRVVMHPEGRRESRPACVLRNDGERAWLLKRSFSNRNQSAVGSVTNARVDSIAGGAGNIVMLCGLP